MIFHGITHNSVEIHKNGPSGPPAPEPIEFLRISNDSGGIPHPENAQKSQKYAEFHGFHIFPRNFAKFTESPPFPVDFAFWSGGALRNH